MFWLPHSLRRRMSQSSVNRMWVSSAPVVEQVTVRMPRGASPYALVMEWVSFVSRVGAVKSAGKVNTFELVAKLYAWVVTLQQVEEFGL
ncbi:hypothetical protein ACIREO_11475 [Streptomyces sp. NPDC102441]|uniref:hypothetical protein n=1 Tax=Streptomyces sp. NPDC102441 TaxID=3366176 RepID=UPI003806B796